MAKKGKKTQTETKNEPTTKKETTLHTSRHDSGCYESMDSEPEETVKDTQNKSQTGGGNTTRQIFNRYNGFIILFLFTAIIIYLLLGYFSVANGLTILEKKFMDFTENAKSMPTLFSELKKASEENDQIKSDQSRISEKLVNLEKSLQNAHGSLVMLMGDFDEKHNKLINLKTDFQHLMDLADKCLAQKDDLSLKFKDHQKNLEAIDRVFDYITKEQSQLKDEIVNTEQKQDAVDNRLYVLDTGISKLDEKLNSTFQSCEEKALKLGTSISKWEESATKLNLDVENYRNKLEKYMKDFRVLQKIDKKLFDDGPEMTQTYTKVMPTSTMVLICIVVSYVPILILFCMVYRKERQSATEVKRKTEYLVQNIGKPTLRWESFSILNEIIQRDVEELEKKYCIVSFHPDTHHRHIRMVGVCVEGRHREKNYEESDFIVTNHESIPNIPYVMVTLVFIDYNKQGQILETPGQDSNDIKLLTVKACHKKSNDVFVIYVGDEESRSLMPGLLFNTHLKTVTEHLELKQLEQKDRVLTVHERFTITQREKIAEAIA